ncbi:MAG: hypothetical protein K6D91_05915 [Prevotella sp.]|nr:hypothetical protein [Prevotella sp.]
MIKILFEVSEDFIRESASPETATAKVKAGDGKNAIKALFDMIGFKQLKDQIDEGKTEFVVTPDKLDDKSKELYNNEIGEICLLAAFSETDNKEE